MLSHSEYGRLNDKQKQAVDELSRNIILLASAGTGKTNTVAVRIANIIAENKAAADEILCLTFTNRACKEMRARIDAIVEESKQLTIKTFHSFCYQIIQTESKKHTDLAYDSIIFDEEDCKEIVKEQNKKIGSLASLQNFIGYIKELRIKTDLPDYKDVVEYAFGRCLNKIQKICVTPQYKTDYGLIKELEQSGYALIEKYNACLAERHGLDFNDLLIQTHELLKNEMVLRAWRGKYKYLHIDEAQDTNEIEYGIISKLFPGNNIMLCADYFQTIYEWRGSAPLKTLDLFKRDYRPVEIHFLENYRATRKLLRASSGYLDNAFGGGSAYNVGVIPKSPAEGKSIETYGAKGIEDEALWIYGKIKNMGKADRLKTAILTRGNKINGKLSEAFDRLNGYVSEPDRIAFMQIDEFRYFRRQEIKDILAYLKLIANRHDENSFKRILLKFIDGIGEKAVEDITSKDNRRLGVRLTDFLSESTFNYLEPYQLLIDEYKRGNVVIFDVESTGVRTALDEIIQISAVRIDAANAVIRTFDRILKPSRPVGASERVHGFSDEYLLKHGGSPKAVLSEFANFINGSLAVGHNVTFDLGILQSQLRRLGMDDINIIDYYDTLDMARRFYPNLENHKLETLCRHFNTKTASDHNALNDVLATAEVLLAILNEKVVPSTMLRMPVYLKYIARFNSAAKDLEDLRKRSADMRPPELIEEIIRLSGIKEVYAGPENEMRRDRIDDFIQFAKEIDEPELNSRDSVNELLRIASLSNSELDRIIEKRPCIPIITIHQSKGAEYDYIFLAGLQESAIPSYQSILDNNIDEEKRLFYVAITRAKKELFLSWSRTDIYGRVKERSRFIQWLPHECFA